MKLTRFYRNLEAIKDSEFDLDIQRSVWLTEQYIQIVTNLDEVEN